MSLYMESRGQGENIIFLHGWGFHGDIWTALTERLSGNYRVISIDLPGYGRSSKSPAPASLDDLTEMVVEACPDQASWAGWSLGGLIALNIAIKKPQSLNKLILLASTPRFTQDDDWPHAIEDHVLDSFSRGLENDYQSTIRRFLALQAQGCPDAKDQIRQLQSQVFMHGEPALETLRNGLQLLKDTDLRARLPEIKAPALILGGERDRLVPPAAIEATRELIPTASSRLIKRAGHAPFLSHTDRVSDDIMEFMRD